MRRLIERLDSWTSTCLTKQGAAIPGGSALIQSSPSLIDLRSRTGGAGGPQGADAKSQLAGCEGPLQRRRKAKRRCRRHPQVRRPDRPAQRADPRRQRQGRPGRCSRACVAQRRRAASTPIDGQTQQAIDAANAKAERAGKKKTKEAHGTAADIGESAGEGSGSDQIETVSDNTTPANALSSVAKLKDLLGQYSEAGRAAITAKGAKEEASPEVLAGVLKDFDDEDPQSTPPSMDPGRHARRSTQALSEQAEGSCHDQRGELRRHRPACRRRHRQEALAYTQPSRFNRALALSLDASQLKFEAEGKGSSSAAIEARQKIVDEYGKKTVEQTIALIEAAFKGDELRQKQDKYQIERSLADSSQQQQLRLGKAPLGQRNDRRHAPQVRRDQQPSRRDPAGPVRRSSRPRPTAPTRAATLDTLRCSAGARVRAPKASTPSTRRSPRRRRSCSATLNEEAAQKRQAEPGWADGAVA